MSQCLWIDSVRISGPLNGRLQLTSNMTPQQGYNVKRMFRNYRIGTIIESRQFANFFSYLYKI